jgi:hypothetical protein
VVEAAALLCELGLGNRTDNIRNSKFSQQQAKGVIGVWDQSEIIPIPSITSK